MIVDALDQTNGEAGNIPASGLAHTVCHGTSVLFRNVIILGTICP